MNPPNVFLPQRIISGGQTGVDRAGLDVAIELGIEHGGWCPAGRIAEDGVVPSRYDLIEHELAAYPARTEQNVIDSDATLILYEGRISGGTLLTKRLAGKHGRIMLCKKLTPAAIDQCRNWLTAEKPTSLNIAGPRESTCPGIQDRAHQFLHAVFSPVAFGGLADL